MINEKLFVTPKPVESPKVRLFLFPYAGGSAATFIPWAKYFNEDVEMICIQPPGRGARFNEPPYDSMESLVGDLAKHASYITEIPYILFGHSLGCRVAFELTCRLKELGLPSPSYFIASGSRAPHLPRERKPIHDLPDTEFMHELKALNGTPEEILENPELMQLLMPLLRADLRIADNYQSSLVSVDAPILVLHGNEDTLVEKGQLRAWKELTERGVSFTNIPGGHFFLNENPEKVTKQIDFAVKKTLENSYMDNLCYS